MNMLDLFPVALLVLWLTPVCFIVVNYRQVVHRRRHMVDTLTRMPKRGEPHAPAEHYLKIFAPSWDGKTDPNVLRNFLSDEFDRLHGRAWRYCLSTLLLMVVSLIAIQIVFDGLDIRTLPAIDIFRFDTGAVRVGKLPAVVPALAGAYVASVLELYLRTRAGDLTPDEIDEVTMRQLLAVPLGRAAFALAGHPFEGLAAFVVPAFPLKDLLRYMRKRTLEKAGVEASKDQGDGPISKWVDGLSFEAIARLEELGITTYTDLAYANPIRILAKTGYSLRLIVQWIDHALLSVYARSHKTRFRDRGIPCALDAVEFWTAHFAHESSAKIAPHDYVNYPDCNCPTVKAFTDKLELDALLVREIFQRVAIDPHVKFLETLWYTGYLGERVESPKCDFLHSGNAPRSIAGIVLEKPLGSRKLGGSAEAPVEPPTSVNEAAPPRAE